MTRLLIIVAAVTFMLFPHIGLAEGFRVDVSTLEAIKHFSVLSIDSLAVGETGLVSAYRLGACKEEGELKIASVTQLLDEPSEYSYVYEVTRRPNDMVSVILSRKGKTPDSEAVKQAVLSILSSPDCEEIKSEGIPLFGVETFLGSRSLSELLKNTETFAGQPVGEKPAENGSGSEVDPVSGWVVTTSKSPIDDSPGVTLFKKAEDGDNALVIRCKEDKTDLFITTEDYLGEDSTSVIVRFDEDKATRQKFSLSTNNRGLFFVPAISNVKKMMKANKLVIRYSTYSGSSRTVTFNLKGLAEKIIPLRKACHW